MKTLKTFQPFVILIALTIHQIFFITFTNSKMPFNISNIMYQERTKDEKSESYLISNLGDVYASDKFPVSYNGSKRSRIPFTDFFHELFIGRTKRLEEKLRNIKTTENATDLVGGNYKNRLHHSAAMQQKITPIVSAHKKRTKSNRLLKKFHRDFRHMRKKWSNVNGSRVLKRDEKFPKHQTPPNGNSTGEHKREMEDFSKNRYKRTTVQGNLKPYYLVGSRNQFDLSGEYSLEYKIKDGNGGNTRQSNDTTDIGTTERNFFNFFSHLVDYDLPRSRSNNISHSKGNEDIIAHPISRTVSLYGSSERSQTAVNFSSAVSEAYKSAEKRIMKWPIKRVVSVEGDIIIGGLMMVHSRGEGDKLCGPIMPQGGVQALEVMLYTLKMINMDPHIPFRIGAHILDDCDTDTYGLEMALDFIKANLHYLDNGRKDSQCSEVTKPIWGVVGAPSSITSIQVSNLLRLFKIPMISPFSTSPELSNKHKYDYFCRTIPSDYYQVQVIAKIIDRLKWTYVSVIYEESNYGIKGLEELEKVLNERKICIAIKEKVLKDSGVPNEAFYDKVVARLLTKPLARGVIVFASDQEVAGIMRAVKRLNITERFSWIGSDGWSARDLVSDGNEEVVEGTISVQPQANPVKGFREYFFNRTPSEHVNPYFAEFWETRFECRLPFVPDTPFNVHFNKPCDPNLSLGLHNVEIENQLQFVHQATCGFCQALINMHADFCGKDFKGVCDKMWKNRGPMFLEYIRRVNFTDFSGDGFQFDNNGDGPARYNIIHYKQTSPNVFKWVKVGKYENGELNLNLKDLQFKMTNKEMPPSSCSQVCDKGEVKKYINGDKCCWKCNSCSKYEVVLPSDETECKRCVLGTKPDSDRKSCVDLEPLLVKSEFYTLSITGSTAFGFFNVVTTFMVYVCNFNSAIVRASSREAQILVLTGALFLHANAYSFLLDPDEVVCSMQSYFSGIGYILIYGTLFWKSYRIVRIFDLSSHYKNMNSSAFILLVLGLCCIQKIKSVIWTYFVDPRKVTFYYPDEDTKIKLCSAFTTLEIGYFIAYIFPLTSIIFCYLRTKKITNTPKIFNDSPQIFFSIRFTLISWIAMFIMHFMTSDIPLRQNILAIITNLNGIGIVFALFYRSMFIIIFRPQLNTREYLRASRANHTMKTSQNEDSQQAIARDTISQLVMNELSGECSYNNYDSNIQISTPNENSKCESTKREVSVQVSEHFLSPRRRKKFPSFDRASSISHIEEITCEIVKTNKHVAFSDLLACKSESDIPRIEVNHNHYNMDSEPSSSELTVKRNNQKITKFNKGNEDEKDCNNETKNQTTSNREDFSSSESIHEMFIEEKCVDEEAEEYAIMNDEEVCHQEAQTKFQDEKNNVNFDSNRVYFKVVACVEDANVSELEYMTLIVDSKVDGI